MSGWVVEDDHVRLRDDSCVPILSQLLNQEFERCKNDYELGDVIWRGDGIKLRELLQQTQIPITTFRPSGRSLLNLALLFHQVGIAQILVKEYNMDVNAIDNREPCILLSHGAAESVIIEFIKEFNVDVNVSDGEMSFLNNALLYKCFDVVHEECEVDINATYLMICALLLYILRMLQMNQPLLNI